MDNWLVGWMYNKDLVGLELTDIPSNTNFLLSFWMIAYTRTHTHTHTHTHTYTYTHTHTHIWAIRNSQWIRDRAKNNLWPLAEFGR